MRKALIIVTLSVAAAAFGFALAVSSVVVNASLTKKIVNDAIDHAFFGDEDDIDIQDNN